MASALWRPDIVDGPDNKERLYDRPAVSSEPVNPVRPDLQTGLGNHWAKLGSVPCQRHSRFIIGPAAGACSVGSTIVIPCFRVCHSFQRSPRARGRTNDEISMPPHPRVPLLPSVELHNCNHGNTLRLPLAQSRYYRAPFSMQLLPTCLAISIPTR